MAEATQYDHIIEKLSQGIEFGLYEDGQKCYFEDGECIHYRDLWKAVRIMFDLGDGPHGKTLYGLFPDSFRGVHERKFNRLFSRKR